MKRDAIDGVTVLWRELSGPLTAELTFGCGHRDEELDTIGLTHLVQRLACPTPDHAGLASHITTCFKATGSPQQVADDLAAICSALASPQVERLAEEAGPFDRFSGLGSHDDHVYPFASLLSHRFGPHGLGLVRWPPVDYGLFTASQVFAHASRHFTSANAVLTLTGSPPPGLRLPLPQGPKVSPVSSSYRSTPFWYHDEVSGAGISFHAEAGPLPYFVLRLVLDRLDASLDAVPEGKLLDATWHEVGITLTPKARQANAAAAAIEAVWAELRRLADSGPAQAELDAIMAGLPQEEPEKSIDSFEPDIERELFGTSESFELAELAHLAAATPHHIRAALSGWLRTAIMVVPRGARSPVLDGVAEAPCPTSTHVPAGQVYKPSLLKRMRGQDSHLVVDPSGVSIVDDPDIAHFTASDGLLVLRHEQQVWLGNPAHGCLHEISAFGRAGEAIWQAAPPLRRRPTVD